MTLDEGLIIGITLFCRWNPLAKHRDKFLCGVPERRNDRNLCVCLYSA